MREAVSKTSGRVAAIYARVSSERQREQQTIESQVAGLRELADERGLLIPDELVFCDEGFSGATLIRPALERLRDRAAEGAFEVLLCHAPDRLARRYAYQVLLLEELARAGVEVVFARGGERSGSPEDELLRQFQGMIAEYERAQIRERTRRGKLHRARTGSQAVMAGAPYGYRFVRKTEHTEGYWEVDEAEAQVVRELFRRYVEDGCSIADLARWLTDQGIATRKDKSVWDRSTVWGMLRNPAYRGQAAYGKTKVADRHGKPTRTTRARGERHGRRQVRVDEPVDRWMFISVPALVSEEQFALAQERLRRNARFAKRNTREPGPLQGLVVCRECGYSCYRTSTRTTKRKIVYYRCIGQDNWRHVGGRVCQSRPIRADELEPLVWGEVRRLLEDPALVRAEIDRRLHALRTEHPAARRREALERDLTRAAGAIERLIEAYQEQLLSLDELRARMPALRKRQTTLQAQLDGLEAELHDAETYLKLADTLEGFLTRLDDGLDQLNPGEQQRILRLVVREVLIGGDEDKITIRHSIPTPNGSPNGSYPLRGSSPLAPAGEHRPVCARSPLRARVDGDGQRVGASQAQSARRADLPAGRYADDFVVVLAGRKQHAEALIAETQAVLAPLGLTLSQEKTRVTHIDEGIEFLGWRIQRHRASTGRSYVYTYASKPSLQAVKAKVKAITRCGHNQTLGQLLHRLNPVLRGWCAYFRGGVSGRTFSYLRAYTWRRVTCWLRRKHPKANWRWLKRRYLPRWWPTDGDTVLYDPGSVRIEYYRYRGAKIATPWAQGRFQRDPQQMLERLQILIAP